MRPLPIQMLRQTATLNATANVNAFKAIWGGTDVELTRVCVQRKAGVSASGDSRGYDIDVQPLIELYYDYFLSRPRGVDWYAIKRSAETAGGAVYVTYAGVRYTVTVVDALLDERGRPHHYRMELT